MDYLNTQYTCTQILSIRNSAYSTFLLKINCCFLHIIIPVYCLSHTFVFNNCCDLIITCNLLKWLVSQDFSVNLPKKSTVYQMVDFIIFLETVFCKLCSLVSDWRWVSFYSICNQSTSVLCITVHCISILLHFHKIHLPIASTTDLQQKNYRCFVEFDNLLLVLLVLWSSKQCTFYDNSFELPIFNWFHSSLWNIIIVCISTEFCFHKCLSMKIHFWRMFLFTTCCKFTNCLQWRRLQVYFRRAPG